MKKIKDSVAAKMYIAFGLIILLMVVSVLLGIRFISTTENRGIQLYDNYGVVQADAAMSLSDFNEVKVNIRNILYLYSGNEEKLEECKEEITALKTEITECLDRVAAVELDEDSRSYLEAARKNIDIYLNDVDNTLAYLEQGDFRLAQMYFMENGVASAIVAKENLVDMITSLKAFAAQEKDLMHKANLRCFFVMIGILVFAAVFAFDIAYTVTGNIRRPVGVLIDASKKVAEGDTDVEISQTSTDEMGVMMKCVDEIVENIRKQESVMERIADGDLRMKVVLRSERDIMGRALKKMVDDNNFVLRDIQQAAWQISNGSSELSAASQTLAQGATEQASAIEQITASIKDIASQARQNADLTEDAKLVVENAKNSAVSGNGQMQEMVKAMHGINEASENISKIIRVIDDIAFQTNILALNAAVEAQRAGTHGKGFAVVAEEVRSLAAKSAAASKETEELIEDSIKKVEYGSKLAENTAEALRDITQRVEQIVELIEGSASASNIQAAAASQIDTALSQVSTVVQTNSATSEECAAACVQLSGQAERLKELLGHYRLAE